jgi:hypothetical protein
MDTYSLFEYNFIDRVGVITKIIYYIDNDLKDLINKLKNKKDVTYIKMDLPIQDVRFIVESSGLNELDNFFIYGIHKKNNLLSYNDDKSIRDLMLDLKYM